MRGLILSAVAGVATLVAFAMPSTAEAHGYGYRHYHHGYYRPPVVYRAPIVVPPVRWGVGVGVGVGTVAPYCPPGAAVAPYGGFQVYGGVAGGVAAPYAPVVPRYYP